LDCALPTHPAGGRGVEVTTQAFRVEARDFDVDRVRGEAVRKPGGDRPEPLGQAEPECELLVVAGRPHRDGDGLTLDPDLERLLDGDEIVLLAPGPPAA